MKKTVEHYYCDRCGKEISYQEHNSEKNYIGHYGSCPIHILCKECFKEFEPKRKEFFDWLTMDGCALACEGTRV